MKKLSKSTFIFDLIDEFEIFNLSGSTNVFTDEAFNLFCKKYKSLSKQRDLYLFKYLKSTPNLFRTHLPHSKWALSMALNIVWYYDEIVISDPIIQLINSEKGELESKKHDLQDIIYFLKCCQESIEYGYLLFSGDHLTPDKTGQFERESKDLVNVPQVLNAFEQISILLKKPSPINDNPSDNLTQVEIIYDGLWGHTRKMGMFIPPHVLNYNTLGNSIYFDFTTPYERISKEELISYDKGDMLDSLKSEYSKDISIVLESIVNAMRLNLPVLFYRDADGITAKHYASSKNEKHEGLFTDTSVYDCLVPYVEGIPAEKLFEVRNQIPEAFKDFRALLFEIVKKTMNATDNPAEIKFKIDSELNSLLRKLDVEMQNAQRKWKFQGIGTPIVMLIGSLSLYSPSGIDYSNLLSTLLGSGGLIKSLVTWNNVSASKKEASLNPVYFLWKAKKN